MTNSGATSSTPGVFIDAHGKKTFIPLENNPAVFTDLVHRLGISPELGFYDVYSVDDRASLAAIPRPVHALIFISPADVWRRVRRHDSEHAVYPSKELRYDGAGPDEPVIWFKQTIGHACGLIALLHSVVNGSARRFITPGSLLDRLLAEALPLKPLARADVLYRSEELERAHMASAVKGDTIPPSSAEPNGYHFISFVPGKDGHLYELEGAWGGPLDRGPLPAEQDMLDDKALDAIKTYLNVAEGNVEFSIVALASRPAETA